MRISAQWRHILRHAWSVRLIIISAILGGLQAAIMVVGVEWLPVRSQGWLVAIVVAINLGAVVARIVDQKNLDA